MKTISFFSIACLLFACSEEQESISNNTGQSSIQPPVVMTEPEFSPSFIDNDAAVTESPDQFKLDNKHYLFDVTNHSVEELRALLERIEEITEASPETFDKLKMVMVLHGPDIDLFTKQNYDKNKDIVDLAAKLDAFDIVDMKVCETTIDSLGFERQEIPPFIESVRYAPETIKSLEQQGYINL